MADDITLTVRVRDLTRGDFSRMGQRLNSMRQSMNGLGTSSRNASIHSQRLSRDIDSLGNSFLRMRNEGRLTTAELNNMRGALVGMQRDARNAQRAGDLTREQFRSIRGELRNMRREFDRFDSSGLARFGRIGRMAGTALGPLRMLGQGFLSLGQSAMRGNDMALIALGTILLLGPAAQALGAILTVALGGAFIGLGALALKSSKAVKSAFDTMKSTVASTAREAAQPLEASLSAGLLQVGKSVQAMKADLTEAFTATAPLVEDFFGAFTDLAAKALPGIVEALKSMGPVMEGFRSAMGSVGKGIGDMFAAMTANGGAQALKQVWLVLGNEIRNLLVNIGEFINFAAKSESATLLMVGAFRLLSGIIHIVEGALTTLDTMLQGVMATIEGILGPLLSLFDMDIPGMDELFKFEGAEGAKTALTDMKAAQEAAAKAAQDHAKSIKGLIEQIQGLAELNRSHLDAQGAQQEALDKAQESMGKYSNALKMHNGVLDQSNSTAREARELLTNLAQTTQEATNKAIEANAPWSQVQKTWQTGYSNIVKLADGMGLSKAQAKALAEQIIGLPPSKDIWVKARVEQAKADLNSVIAQFRAFPDSESVTVNALTADAIGKLEALGFKVEHLPNGKTKVTSNAGDVTATVNTLLSALANLDGTTVSTYANHYVTQVNRFTTQGTGQKVAPAHRDWATGGKLPGFAGGGSLQSYPNGGFVSGPGTSMSDSIITMLGSGSVIRASDTEFVVNAKQTRKHRGLLEMINSDRLPRFAKGGKVSQAAKERARSEREARSDARGDLTISHFGKMAGFKTTEFAGDLARPDALAGLVGALNNWRNQIKKATHGGVEKNLLQKLDKAGKALIKYEKSLNKVEKSLEKAKDKLNDLKTAASQMRESVKSNVLSSTNITKIAGGDAPVTVAGIMAQMRQGRDKSGAFSQALKDLKAKGVNKTIIEQIAEAGIEGGGLETAGALLGASGSELASINSMQSQINAFAAGAGNTAADALYGAGIKAAEGLVKGLTKKKKDIENAMMAIAKSMEKAIKSALGIKSPSKVMEKVGRFTAEGFAVGMEKNRRAQNAVNSMVNLRQTGGTGGRMTDNVGPQIIQVRIGDKILDEIILDSNRRSVRTRGGNVQAVFSQR